MAYFHIPRPAQQGMTCRVQGNSRPDQASMPRDGRKLGLLGELDFRKGDQASLHVPNWLGGAKTHSVVARFHNSQIDLHLYLRFALAWDKGQRDLPAGEGIRKDGGRRIERENDEHGSRCVERLQLLYD
jgi:hypothetical protein